MTPPTQPLIVSAGEPAGIGPELCLAVAAQGGAPPFAVIGDATLFEKRAADLDIDVAVRRIESPERPAAAGELLVVDRPFPAAVEPGIPDVNNAETLLAGLRDAVEGCLAGDYAGLVTAPVAKHVINDAGIAFTGHTEFIAELTATPLPVMLLVSGELRVALVTTHLPLRDVSDAITAARVRDVLTVLIGDLSSRFGIAAPDIVVCGLNPHAGEGGHLGHEDAEVIAPVIDELRSSGHSVRGPLPADTAFTPAAGTPDAIVAMYHDQGLPVIKHAGFGRAVNVTLGLPIIRTSVDHGTAFDLAGTGRADPGSLRAAIELAATLAHQQ